MNQRRWRDDRTRSGRRPVRDYVLSLSEDARTEVAAAMKDVRIEGLTAARHVRGEIQEVRASHAGMEFRILFATEGSRGQILLALEGFDKKTARTPPRLVDLVVTRLADWRDRAG